MLFSVPAQLGYAALAGFVFAESAGVPVPGETALTAAGLLVRSGQLSFGLVVLVAAAAAIAGDNLGFALGRRGGRALLLRKGRFDRHRHRAVAAGDRLFARHGAKTVFFGRWITGVKTVSTLMAGASQMPWRAFAVYNTLGALTWAASVAGLTVLLGPVAVAIFYAVGLSGVATAALVAAVRGRAARRGDDGNASGVAPAPAAAP